MNNKMNELSLKEKACKSLLANVLDMDDDLRSYAYIIKIKKFHKNVFWFSNITWKHKQIWYIYHFYGEPSE